MYVNVTLPANPIAGRQRKHATAIFYMIVTHCHSCITRCSGLECLVFTLLHTYPLLTSRVPMALAWQSVSVAAALAARACENMVQPPPAVSWSHHTCADAQMRRESPHLWSVLLAVVAIGQHRGDKAGAPGKQAHSARA